MGLRHDLNQIRARIEREGRRPVDASMLGSHSFRLMLGFAVSIGLVAGAVNLPFHRMPERLGWRSDGHRDEIQLQHAPEEMIEEYAREAGAVATRFSHEPAIDENVAPEGDETTTPTVEDAEPLPRPTLERLAQRPILEFADQNPSIQGGLGALYLNIEYPEEAQQKGIHGLTILAFVVEEDGTASNIEVLKSLHPACDSAAVRGIRNTRFVPGRQNGNEVRVKMRLPIRFKLLNLPEAPPEDSLSLPVSGNRPGAGV